MKKNQSKNPMRPCEIYVINLRGLMAMQNVTPTEIMTIMGLSRATFYRRLKKPYQLTADNMERAAKRLGFSSVDMQRSVMTVCEGVA